MPKYDEIKKYLQDTYGNEKYKIEKSIDEIADNNHIVGHFDAFDFDKIKEQIMQDCDSADALYMNKWVNFIEFKTGFAVQKDDINAKTHKENLQLKIRLKAYESLALLEKIILQDAEISPNVIEGKRRFVAVIDCEKHTDDAIVDIIADVAKTETNTGFKADLQRWLNNSLAVYRRKASGTNLFYDDTQVWYDYEFEAKSKIL